MSSECIFREKREFFELTTKKTKKVVRIFAWKIGNFPGKSEILSSVFEIFCNRIHDP